MSRKYEQLSQEEFERIIQARKRNGQPVLGNKALMALFKDLIKYKKHDLYKKYNPIFIDHFRIIDAIERKQTCLERELMVRGYANLMDAEERDEYLKWQQKEFKNKTVW